MAGAGAASTMPGLITCRVTASMENVTARSGSLSFRYAGRNYTCKPENAYNGALQESYMYSWWKQVIGQG